MKIRSNYWGTAYRQLPTGSIIEDRNTPFTVIKNTWKYCSADPFIFNHKGKTYIFAELINALTKRGEIGYCVYDGTGFTKWVPVIREPYHLSYPNIFEYKDKVYIVPESNQGDNLCLYEAADFPDKWEKVRVLKNGVKCVDTTFLCNDGDKFAFTYDISDQNNKRLLMYRINADFSINDGSCVFVSNNDSSARPGGNFFCFRDKTIRVSQDCKDYYGKGLVFSEVKSVDDNQYDESILFQIGYEDIVLYPKMKVIGIHTYNSNEQFEVIDFKRSYFKPAGLIGRFLALIRRIINKGNK